MVFRRIMTGIAASVVIAFSAALFCTLWRINSMDIKLNITGDEDGFRWQGRAYAAEVQLDDGRIERLVFYRRQ